MSAATEIRAALLEVESVFGNTITHRGNSYACNASAFERAQTWDDGAGGHFEYRVSFTIRKNAVTGTAIAENDTVVHQSKNLRVIRIIHFQDGLNMRVFCDYEKS